MEDLDSEDLRRVLKAILTLVVQGRMMDIYVVGLTSCLGVLISVIKHYS